MYKLTLTKDDVKYAEIEIVAQDLEWWQILQHVVEGFLEDNYDSCPHCYCMMPQSMLKHKVDDSEDGVEYCWSCCMQKRREQPTAS